MAHKPATPGTGFNAPLYLLDKDLEVIGTWEGGDVGASVAAALTDIEVDTTDTDSLSLAVIAISEALGGSVQE